MTSQPDAAIETIVLYALLSPDDYCTAVVTVLVVYDWMVTLSREVELFWTGNARPLSAALYFSTKYLNILAQVVNMVAIWDFSISDEGCTRVVVAGQILICLSIAPPAAFAGLRAYALTQRRWLSALIFLLSCIPVVLNMLFFRFNIVGFKFPILGCVSNTTLPPSIGQIFIITERISTILADTMLIIITWKQIMFDGGMKVSSQINVTKPKGLASVMLCDGILYFVVLLSLNIVQFVLTELSLSSLSLAVLGDSSRLIGFFTAPSRSPTAGLSSVLVSHFLLDLQEAHQRKVVGLATDDPLRTSQSFGIRSVNLMPALGSLAATIHPAAHYNPEDGDEGTDGGRFGIAEKFHTHLDGGESTRDVRIEDESAMMEVLRPGDT